MNWNEPSVIVSIIAVGIALISLSWNIFAAILRNRPSLNVRFSVLQQMISNMTGGLDNPVPMFTIKITNTGFTVRDIERPTFKLIGFTLNGNNAFNVVSMRNPVNFPQEIQPGKRFCYDILVYSFMEKFKTEITSKAKLRIIVADTYGRKYRSNKIKISEIEKQVRVAQHFETAK